jgi:hypothetical protein
LQFKRHQPTIEAKYLRIKSMPPNYPPLPDSPSVSNKSIKKSKSTKKPPSSPLSTVSDIPEIEDFEKYEVRRAATGTGIFSSLFTLAIVTE